MESWGYHIKEGGVIVLIFEHDAQFERIIQLLAVERILGQNRHRPLFVAQRSVTIQRANEEQFALLVNVEVVRVEAGADGELDLLRFGHDGGIVVGIPCPDGYDGIDGHCVLHDTADGLVLDQELGFVVVDVDDGNLPV